ncbi:hypothetical protein WHR41_07425 [Cladosporium halotolerans]|uniref:Asl1-like glycosyl hydrolase catalytic domain-containing protein n=1 Tax=Cladosporium halotolerans TaxID=1052096 RepID=A0AB34KGY6_9PEZI
MAPVNTLSVLAFATAALAVPYNHGHGHAKYHNNRPSGFSAYPYPNANGTIHATGTGFATGAAIAPASETDVVAEYETVSDVETTTAVVPTTYADASSSPCTTDVTVTSTAKVTVTVTPGASSQAASSPASSEAAAVQSSSESSAPAYSQAPTSYSTKAEAQTQSAPAAYSSPAPTSSAVSSAESSAAPSPTLTYAAANKNVDLGISYGGSPSSSSAAPSSSASSSSSDNSSKGKRGVAYNDASLTECLVSSPAIGWGYNWGSSSSGLSDSVKFVPMLWGPTSEFTDSWSDNAKSAIDSGSTHLFSFNEPDLGSQANLTPQEAADAWRTYMEPFAGKAKLCSPSVTNGGGDMGLNWLSSFLESCSDCTIDCLNVHWYDSAENVEYFKKHVNDALDLADGKKDVFVSEFAATGSDDQISTFLETVMPWMDDMSNVGGYAYFMAGEGKLVSGSEQSAIGKTYAS